MRLRRLFVPVLALALAAPALAQDTPRVSETDGPLTVTLRVDPLEVDLGAPVVLELAATVDGEDPDGTPRRIGWPDLIAELPEALGEYTVEVAPHRRAGHVRTLATELSFFDAGEFTLPPLTVTLLDGAEGEEPPSVVLLGVTVKVRGVLPEEPERADGAPPPELPEPKGTRGEVDVPEEALAEPESSSIAWWITAALVLAAVAAWWFLRKIRPTVEAPAPPPPPPHERALAALERLLARHLPESGEVEPYFVELSEILRQYVEDRFGLRAPEQTTEEFLADLQQTEAGRRAIGEAQRAVLRDFLTRADLVKFARDEPDLGTCVQAADAARSFVQETAPRSGVDAGAPTDDDEGVELEDLLA